MNLFDQFKQLKHMKDLQDQLGQERTTIEKEGVRVTVSGKMEVEEIVLNPSLDAGEQQKIIKDCVNQALKEMQAAAARRFLQLQQ